MIKIERPIVTIGIPTYNRADGYLQQALESAVNQTYPNVEIIVADNCSTDNTESLVLNFAQPRITYYKHKKNIGAINNFNFCVEKAKGDFFLMLHDDDILDSDILEVCMAAADYNSDEGVILTGTRQIDENGIVAYETPNQMEGGSTLDFFMGWFHGKIPLYLCSTLYNTKKLKQMGGFSAKANNFLDVAATVKLAADYGRVDVFDAKASFRRHGNNMGADPNKVYAWCDDCRYLLDLMCSLSPGDETAIKKLGYPYFSRKCYKKAWAIKNPFDRWFTYWRIFCSFNFAQSPYYALRRFDFHYLTQRVKSML